MSLISVSCICLLYLSLISVSCICLLYLSLVFVSYICLISFSYICPLFSCFLSVIGHDMKVSLATKMNRRVSAVKQPLFLSRPIPLDIDLVTVFFSGWTPWHVELSSVHTTMKASSPKSPSLHSYEARFQLLWGTPTWLGIRPSGWANWRSFTPSGQCQRRLPSQPTMLKIQEKLVTARMSLYLRPSPLWSSTYKELKQA